MTPTHLEDKTLTCRHCGNPFIFTTGEQSVRLSRGRNETPTRCPRCERRTGPETPSSFDTMRLTDD